MPDAHTNKKEGARVSGTEATNLVALQEEQAVVIVELSLQHPKIFFIILLIKMFSYECACIILNVFQVLIHLCILFSRQNFFE